jgi:hypothetical protein
LKNILLHITVIIALSSLSLPQKISFVNAAFQDSVMIVDCPCDRMTSLTKESIYTFNINLGINLEFPERIYEFRVRVIPPSGKMNEYKIDENITDYSENDSGYNIEIKTREKGWYLVELISDSGMHDQAEVFLGTTDLSENKIIDKLRGSKFR